MRITKMHRSRVHAVIEFGPDVEDEDTCVASRYKPYPRITVVPSLGGKWQGTELYHDFYEAQEFSTRMAAARWAAVVAHNLLNTCARCYEDRPKYGGLCPSCLCVEIGHDVAEPFTICQVCLAYVHPNDKVINQGT